MKCSPCPTSSVAAACFSLLAADALGHAGRRVQIGVQDGQLFAQGFNSAGVAIDPAGPRPYYNAVHDHWTNPDGVTSSVPSSDLPGFDVGPTGAVLDGFDIRYTLTGAGKWTGVSSILVPDPAFPNPTVGAMPAFVPDGTTLSFDDLAPLDDEESILFRLDGADLSTDALPGSVTLVEDLDASTLLFDGNGLALNGGSNGYDIDPFYFHLDSRRDPTVPGETFFPEDTLYVLRGVLSTDTPGIADSEPVYTLLSPDGTGPVERLHFAALFAEEQLSTPIPEPAAGAVLLAALACVTARRRR